MVLNAMHGDSLPVYGDGRQVRNWLYVEDFCRGIHAVLLDGRPGEAYNVGGPDECENIEVVRRVIELTGADESLIEHVTDRPGHDRRYSLSSEKLRTSSAGRPEVHFAEGLERTVQLVPRERGLVGPDPLRRVPRVLRKTVRKSARLMRLRRRRRRRRLLALLPVRDEMRFLPGLFENLAEQVDGVLALDDGSNDGSREFLEAQPLVVEVIDAPSASRGELDDGANHRALTEAAWEHRADWLLGVDADERLERRFRKRAEAEIDRAEAADQPALWVRFCELWDAPDRMRVDGIWGGKRKACLFRSDRGHRFHGRRMHSIWAPWPPPKGEYPAADLRIYHLRMIRAGDRRARVERYRRLDPDNRWQELGYDYLVDEQGISLRGIEPGRDYVGVPAR